MVTSPTEGHGSGLHHNGGSSLDEQRLPPPETEHLSDDQRIDSERDYINYLLQRALKSVPFVKLDSVDECIKLFQEAVEYMEDNVDESLPVPDVSTMASPPATSLGDLRAKTLIHDDSADSSNATHSHPAAAIPQEAPPQPSAPPAVIAPSAETGTLEGRSTSGGERGAYVANKLLGVQVTRDYSSPRTSARSLGAGPGTPTAGAGPQALGKKAPSMIGLGANKAPSISAPSLGEQRSQSGPRMSSRASGVSQVAAAFGASTFNHKPSSRAQHAAATADDPPTDDYAEDDTVSPPVGLASESEMRGVARPLPNKLLSRVGGGSKEFPSPKMGGRSLGSASGPSRPAPQQAQPRSASVPQGRLGLTGERERSASIDANSGDQGQQLYQQTYNHSHNSDQDSDYSDRDSLNSHIQPASSFDQAGTTDGSGEDSDFSVAEPIDYNKSQAGDGGDMTVAHMHQADGSLNPDFDFSQLAMKKDKVAQLKAAIPIPVNASPKQFRSSLTLLDLAKKTSEPDITDDGDSDVTKDSHTPITTRPLQPAQFARLQESSGIGSPGGGSGTPKPAWLRRLDSPLTHHGKLMQAKSQLHQLMKRAMIAAPRVKGSASRDAITKVLQAVDKLESSTTVAAATGTTLPPIPNM